MVKLTSKVQKNMFEHAKNRKTFLGGISPDPLAALVPSGLEEPPNFFHLPTALTGFVQWYLVQWYLCNILAKKLDYNFPLGPTPLGPTFLDSYPKFSNFDAQIAQKIISIVKHDTFIR